MGAFDKPSMIHEMWQADQKFKAEDERARELEGWKNAYNNLLNEHEKITSKLRAALEAITKEPWDQPCPEGAMRLLAWEALNGERPHDIRIKTQTT